MQTVPTDLSILSSQRDLSLPCRLGPNSSAGLEQFAGPKPAPRGTPHPSTASAARPSALPQPARVQRRDSAVHNTPAIHNRPSPSRRPDATPPCPHRTPQSPLPLKPPADRRKSGRATAPPQPDGATRRRRTAGRHALAVQGGNAPSPPIGSCARARPDRPEGRHRRRLRPGPATARPRSLRRAATEPGAGPFTGQY